MYQQSGGMFCAQQLLLSTLRCLLPALVVLAPPCGTASRARDIPAYSNGKRIANPLRSGQHADGLPSLQGHDLARVTSANSLYAFAAAVAGMRSQHGIPWLIENPARSYMWDTSMMSALPEHSQTEVHFCAYGGARRKRIVLKGTPTWLQNLCRTTKLHCARLEQSHALAMRRGRLFHQGSCKITMAGPRRGRRQGLERAAQL